MSKSQSEMIREIMDELDNCGHEVDFGVLDMLDVLGTIGVQLVENTEVNLAALEYYTILQPKKDNDAGPG